MGLYLNSTGWRKSNELLCHPQVYAIKYTLVIEENPVYNSAAVLQGQRGYMNKRLMIGLAMPLFYAVFFISGCTCRSQNQEHSIRITGSATVYAVPDQAVLSFSIVSREKNLSDVKTMHDSALQKTNALFDTYKIEQKDITAENLTIHPRYSYNTDSPQFLYYEIQQNMSVSITDLEQYESFLTDLLNSGIDRINDVRFSAKDIAKYKNDARIAAVKAAEEKAALLCAAAENNGKKLSVGNVIHISEIPIYSYSDGYNAAQNSIAYAKSSAAADESTPIGKIRFDAQVEMVFELQ